MIRLIVVLITVFFDLLYMLMLLFVFEYQEINGIRLRYILICLALILSCVFVNQLAIDILY